MENKFNIHDLVYIDVDADATKAAKEQLRNKKFEVIGCRQILNEYYYALRSTDPRMEYITGAYEKYLTLAKK